MMKNKGKRFLCISLVLILLFGGLPVWTMAEPAQDEIAINSIEVALSQVNPVAGEGRYYPTLLSVNGESAMVSALDNFYSDWYESDVDDREHPNWYMPMSTDTFVLDRYYDLNVFVSLQSGYSIGDACEMIAIFPDGTQQKALLYQYDIEYGELTFDFLFDATDYPLTTIQVDGYVQGGLISDVAITDDRSNFAVGTDGAFGFFTASEEGYPDISITDPAAVFEEDTAYWLLTAVSTDGDYSLGDFTAHNFAVAGGCEDLQIYTYDSSHNLLFLMIRLNRFTKPAQTYLQVDGYALGSQGQDVTVAVDSEEFMLAVGGGVPYALLGSTADGNPGYEVGTGYLQPETEYWLGIVVTNEDGDFAAYNQYDFHLNLPYNDYFIEKYVEYMLLYYRLKPLDFEAVNELDLHLENYCGGNTLDQASLFIEQKGFEPFTDYGVNFGFCLDDNGTEGDYLEPIDADTMKFSSNQILWLRVSVVPEYNTVFANPPRIGLDVPYTDCWISSGEDGSLILSFQLEPVKKAGPIEIALTGYALGGAVTDLDVNVSGPGAELYPGGYGDSFAMMLDDESMPGTYLEHGTLEADTLYWVGVALIPESGFDLSQCKEEDFALQGMQPETSFGYYNEHQNRYYIYFCLPALSLAPVNTITTFTLTGYQVGENITDIMVTDDSDMVMVPPGYLHGPVILPEMSGKPDDLNIYHDGTFTADTTYWLGLLVRAEEGYSLKNVTGEYFQLADINYSQVIVENGYDEVAYVYFKLPALKPMYEVGFYFQGGLVCGQLVEEGKCAVQVADPAVEGKVFLGWYTEDGVQYDFTTPVTGNINLIATFADATPAVLYGDVDGNEAVSAADALMILKSVVGKVTLTDAQKVAGDLDGNGNVNAADALLVLKKVVGKVDKFPVEE